MDPLEQLNATLSDRYDVEREVGAGGMATVYLARDLRHDRRVALKVLRPELGAVLGVGRFLAEIKVTANLQHPNILPLFDSGEAGGLLFYVMPFVDGETLRARLEREKQLPVDDALSITRAIANALDYAHAENVIHRDLKPENILFQAGQPVLADFGIALAVANAGGARITQTGLSLGTPQYMSPEQATGDRVIDGRTDLYSLAAVLYEMLAGEPPHTGSTAQAIIARVLTDKPRSVRSSRNTVPVHVDAAIERGLAKLPADRFSTGRDFAHALGSGFATGTYNAPPLPQDFRFSLTISRAALVRSAKWIGIAAAVVLGAWGWLRKPVEVRQQHMRFTLQVPDSLAPVSANMQHALMVSPDGSELLYPTASSGTPVLARRRFDNLAISVLPESRGTDNPRYSANGQWLLLGSTQRDRIFKLPLAGGPNVTVAKSGSRGSWGDDGTVVFVDHGSLWRVSDAGGVPVRLTRVDSAAGESAHTWPHVLPGSQGVLFEISPRGTDIDSDEIAVATLPEGKITKLGLHGTNPRYVPGGLLLFARQDGTVSAAPFDLRRLRVNGPAVNVLENVIVKSGGAAQFSVSNTGTLAYIEGASSYVLALADQAGKARRLTRAAGRYAHPRMSPSGDRVLLEIREGSSSDVWTLNIQTNQLLRLTRDGKSRSPEWISGGTEVAWVRADSTGDVIRAQAADGSGLSRSIPTAFKSILEVSASPRGDVLAVTGGATGLRTISLISVNGSTAERPLLSEAKGVYVPSISPDGQWIAFTTAVAGRVEVFIASMSDPTHRLQVTTDGGRDPVWSPSGASVFYRAAGLYISAAVSFRPRFEVTKRDTLALRPYAPLASLRSYDISRRTGEFLVVERDDAIGERIILVTGWLDEVKERMASANRR